LAIPVRDQERSRRFYETYFGFGARPARRYDDGVLMLYDANGFALALGPAQEPIGRPGWMHFGSPSAIATPCWRCATVSSRTVSSWSRSGTSRPT
jgi:catechol 2,3-dioxygenase-like lactoylglutathione lyase family enzyme